MIRLLVMGALPFLVACGVSGPPVPPAEVEEEEQTAPASGITITGSAEMGISG